MTSQKIDVYKIKVPEHIALVLDLPDVLQPLSKNAETSLAGSRTAAVIAARNVFRDMAGSASELPTRPGVAFLAQEGDTVNEVSESFEVEQRSSSTSGIGEHPTTELLKVHGLRLPTEGRHPRAPFKSTLSDADLQCLLRVIEGELIPRLIGEYSPARCLPRESGFRSD